jgi:3-oxoadipate enol-lactonase
MQRGSARIGGGEIAYEVRGDGPTLLLLHAFPLGRCMWEPQVEALCARFRLARFDCRGFGASPPGDSLLTMERYADDAVGLLDHLGLSQAVVIGLSMGGYAAFALVRRHPLRLRGLVLADTRAEPDTEGARQERALLAERVRREGAEAAAEVFLPRLLGKTSQEQRPELVARVRATILGNRPRGISDALAGLAARADSRPTLREIRVPTLVLCGDEDTLTPPLDARKMAEAIPGSRLGVIPRAGHLANLENPEAFNAALEGFLGSLGG